MAEAKAAEAQQLAQALSGILDLHRAEFPIVARPIAPPIPPVDTGAIRRKHRQVAKAHTSIFNRTRRKAALAQADNQANVEIMEARALHEQQRVNHQAELDAWWAGLNANNADIVLNALAAAFEDNEAAAAPVGIDNGEISVVVFVPSTDAIPERKPTTTAAGNLSLKKLTKSEIASFYKYLVYGHTLVTVKETLAVAPQATAVRIAAVRLSDTDSYGRRRPEVILAAKFERSRIAGVRWQHADSEQIVNDTNSILLLKQKGATKELHPLNLNEEPELASLLPAVDFSETTSAG